jgi:ADP-ribose pyrophosphatase
MPKKFKKLAEETIHENHCWIYKKDLVEIDGQKVEYFYGKFDNGVIVVPILDSGQIILIRQYRYLKDRHSVEFPMGGIDEGETPAQAAQRELREETGFDSSNFSKVAEFDPYVGTAKDVSHVFLANELFGDGVQTLGGTEDIEVIARRPDEIDLMIKNGEIWHGQTLATWMLVRDLVVRK